MQGLQNLKEQIQDEGFAIVDGIFSESEVNAMLSILEAVDGNGPAFRKTNDLFAIRQLLKEFPALIDVLFTNSFESFLSGLLGKGYAVIKSIYFDKPGHSNWFVSYHQDLTISVDEKVSLEGFENWTMKQNGFAVQPPVSLLEDNFTVRIHLDDTNEFNGALRVVPKSHSKGICRAETIDWETETETVCNVSGGGVMVMKPLLLHASSRTTENKPRRVIHLEFGRQALPEGLHWAERAERHLEKTKPAL